MAPAAKSTASEGRSPISSSSNSKSAAMVVMHVAPLAGSIVDGRLGQITAQWSELHNSSGFNPAWALPFCKDSPDSTLESRIQCPPLQGQAIHAWHPNSHQGVSVPMPNNAGSGHRRLTGSRSQESTRIESEAATGHPPLLGRGRSCGSFAARLGIRLPRPPRSETKLFRISSCGSGIPLLRPIGSLEPLLCYAGGVIGAPICSVRSGGPGPAIARTRSGLLGRWAAAMVVLREAREWTPTAIELHDGAWGPFICPSR